MKQCLGASHYTQLGHRGAGGGNGGQRKHGQPRHFARGLGRIQRPAAAHAADHIGLELFSRLCQSLRCFEGAVGPVMQASHQCEVTACQRFFQSALPGLQCFAAANQQQAPAIGLRLCSKCIVGILSKRITRQDDPLELFAHRCRPFRRSIAACSVRCSRAKCRRMYWSPPVRKKLEPGTAATPRFLIIHSHSI
jgi:hypothetical protein